MKRNLKTKSEFPIRLRYYLAGAVALWSILIGVSLAWNLRIQNSGTLEAARIEARTAFEKDVIYRRWNAGHGGVYAPVTGVMQPNLYLDVPERDITTLLGKRLTKINPAYMTRQVHELALKTHGIRGHITSLNPIRPKNAPDPWETRALRAFQTGLKEVSSVEKIDGNDYMRLMRPLLTEKGCLKCHATQGYKFGDIRGGISVSIPMTPLMNIGQSHILALCFWHSLLWLVGLAGISFAFRRLNQQVHERIGVEEVLRIEKTLTEEYINSLPGLFYVFDEERFVKWNREWVTASGYSDNEISQMYGPDFFSGSDKAHIADRMAEVFIEGFADAEAELATKQGDRIPYYFTGVRKEINGKPHLIGLGIDITSRKLAEEERKKLQTQLSQALKMEAMGLMAGGVAHDLNNILSGIVSYPELLLMDLPEDSPLRKPIKTMQESGMRAADVVEDLLTIARGVATGKEALNLNTLITEYLGSAEYEKLEETHSFVSCRTELDPELLNMRGSPTHIKKILMNLVTNASEAIEGSGAVTISTVNRYLDEPLKGYEDVHTGEYVMLTVSDNGPGISPKDLDRIFEPFYTKKVMGRSGTGLGLAVVWNSVQDLNGYINVESSGKGAMFELYFPVTREEVAARDEEAPPENYLGHGEKILVVDDEERQREIASGILTRLGYNSETVSSGEEAIEYVKEHPVDLIVLDMVMPKGINGRKTYEEIIKIRPGQKAIIASGYAKTKKVDFAQELGAGKYIKKPYTLAKVGVAVKEELEK